MNRWEHPNDYGGFSPDGDYVLLVRAVTMTWMWILTLAETPVPSEAASRAVELSNHGN